ncbi:MAG TPA: cytochrome c peroxidase [Bryobacteraceae bacterium]|nr:cytochrome c peroxidase [Bryobacteraceae bacterium]
MQSTIIRRLVRITPALLLLWAASAADKPSPTNIAVPLGLAPIVWPADNPYTPDKAELGRLLYFDPRLSADGTVSCATCHSPKYAFTDSMPVSEGIRGQRGTRSAPTIINRAYSLAQFWDGRAATLEEQAKGPIGNPIEMGASSEICVTKLQAIPGYRAWFLKVFGTEDFTIDHVAKAIATFERTVLSGNSPFDRYKSGEKKAITPSQIRGMNVFFKKSKCDKCHDGMNFTTNDYHNLGVGIDKPNPDAGRFAITKNPKDFGAFKTPTLRDIAETPPYMHDGSLKNLKDVVEFYDKGGNLNKNLDPDIKPLKLTADEKADLVEFMRALTGTSWQNIKAPDKFPE